MKSNIIATVIAGALAIFLSGCATVERTPPPQIVEVQGEDGNLIGHRVNGDFIPADGVGSASVAYASTSTRHGIPLLDWFSLPHFWTPSNDVLRANSANYATYAQAMVQLGILRLEFTDSAGKPIRLEVPIREIAKADIPQSPLRENQNLGFAALITNLFRGEQKSRDNAVNQSHETSRAAINSGTASVNAGADAAIRGANVVTP